MEKKSTKMILSQWGALIAVWLLAVSFILTGVTVALISPIVRATAGDNVTSYVLVDEIYAHPENIKTLYNLIAGHDQTTYQQMVDLAYDDTRAVLGRGYSAAAMRANTYGKTAAQDIRITFAGIQWQVMYLSQAINGDPILTVWMADNLAEVGWAVDENGDPWDDDQFDDAEYPCIMYGTSYVRCFLNHGLTEHHQYATDPVTLATYQAENPVVSNILQYRDVITTPSMIGWQASGQDADNQFGQRNPNGNWQSEPSDHWATVNKNTQTMYAITQKNGYDNWKEDYLWLPSINEVGYRGVDGIWGVNQNQRSSTRNVYGSGWVRSGDSSAPNLVMLINENGSGYRTGSTSECHSVRPALHLNLNTAALADHAHEYRDWVTKTPATCVQKGSESAICTICARSGTRSTAILGHDYDAVGTVVAPTCESKGYTRHVCARCGDYYDDTVLDALGHDYDDGMVVMVPTCTGGLKQCTCKRAGCNAVKLAMLGDSGNAEHNMGAWVITQEADCLTNGTARRVCQNANCNYYELQTIHAPGHDYVTTVVDPTCSKNGYTKHECSHCHNSYLDTLVDPTGEHQYGDWQTVIVPTTSSQGLAQRVCAGCEHIDARAVARLTNPGQLAVAIVTGTGAGIAGMAGVIIGVLTILRRRKRI